MSDIIDKLRTPEECETLIFNVKERNPELAKRALKKKVELRAVAYGAKSDAEIEALKAVFAYEEVLSKRNKKKTRASRTWQMIKRHGIIGAVERAVSKKEETIGYTALVEIGLQELAFEVIVLRYPHLFSTEAVKNSKSRLKDWLQAE